MGGRAVCLQGGRRVSAVIVHEWPQELVPYLTYGADRLHVVDHDAAAGERPQLDLLARIIRDSPIPVHVAGGLTDQAAIDQVLALGAAAVVLDGTLAKKPALLEGLCRAYSTRSMLAIEVRDGSVVVGGWALPGGMTAAQLGELAYGAGCAAIVYTDVLRSAGASAPNVAAASELRHAIKCNVFVSGGISTLDDIARLRDAKLAACVVGRALYERRFTVLDAASVAHG
jgi:phosphoribosylformimino-5-aminoimidazole carboxamide ribotide isomerase